MGIIANYYREKKQTLSISELSRLLEVERSNIYQWLKLPTFPVRLDDGRLDLEAVLKWRGDKLLEGRKKHATALPRKAKGR